MQRAYHIMSKDGVTNWTSTGLAYQGTQSPTNANAGWLRYSDGTVNNWHNMENDQGSPKAATALTAALHSLRVLQVRAPHFPKATQA